MFFAGEQSRGPAEATAAGSEFLTYDGADLDIKFLLALARRGHPVMKDVTIPNVYLCIERDHDGRDVLSYRREECDPQTQNRRVLAIRAGLLLVGRGDAVGPTRKFVIPPDFAEMVRRCRTRFLIFNLGISSDSYRDGHANAFLVDTRARRIVRFDPSSKCCFAIVQAVMREQLPGWRVEQHTHRIPVQTRQSDSYRGMCVTFSLLYVILTLLNPQRTPGQIHDHLRSRGPAVLKEWVLRLNRHIANTLRRIRRGILTRSGHANGARLPIARNSVELTFVC